MQTRAIFPIALAVAVAAVTGQSILSAAGAADVKTAPIPAELERLPADPRPGQLLPLTGAREVRAWLTSLDSKAGFGVAKADEGGGTVPFRLLPYTSYRRFGVEGAQPDEFQPGERVVLKLSPAQPGGGSYLLEIQDAISEQVGQGQCYRMGVQDRDNYRFTAERYDVRADRALPEPLTLGYGKGTFLVQRESPVYTFRPAGGSRLWINMAARPDGVRIARETLDEASLKRFQGQQRLRLLARGETGGVPGYVAEAGARGTVVRLFPDYAAWAQRLAPGEELTLRAAGAEGGSAVRFTRLNPANGVSMVELQGSTPALKVGSRVTLAKASREVRYSRDIRPMLEVNCAACHREGAAQSGFSIAPERLRAGGRRGVGIVPGKSGESLVYLLMSGDRNPKMPPDRDITREELALLKAWIDAGARTD